jgi:hypothetical protein
VRWLRFEIIQVRAFSFNAQAIDFRLNNDIRISTLNMACHKGYMNLHKLDHENEDNNNQILQS